MSELIKNLLKFIIFFIILIGSLDIIASKTIEKNADFSLQKNPQYIVLGHSHPECAYNDDLISSFKNLATSGESYFYTYFKLKKILEQNSSIKTIFIEYTNNQITPNGDDGIWRSMAMSHWFRLFSPFIDTEGQYLLVSKNPSEYFRSLSYTNKSQILDLIHQNFDYSDRIGGYLKLERNKRYGLFDNTKSIGHNFRIRERTNQTEVAEWNLIYLEKIITLAQSYNKNVILVRSPQNINYRGYDNDLTYFIILRVIREHFPKADYIDFSDFPFSVSEYGDEEHLNYTGATIYSTWFDNILQKGLLEKTDKQKFVDEEMLLFAKEREKEGEKK